MKVNIGTTDRVIRLFLATIVFTALYLTTTLSETMAISAVVLGLACIITSILGFCPLYRTLRLNTNRFHTPTKKFER
ncbi:MAG: DUF2892 domain-containing protein [Chitinophagaceae bacterium]|nr:DUF2892 domain-containing protein [Chitinophagaceae bacterium]MEA3424791.1 DUF2892 domain-containing protein [Bacteroidota bacterium]MCA6452416.1 DUF2892 domain-containing protein [Chitinophagaceae bacterium]MCA6457374.1 DUF2892 domain-containing protein [Chitinophagaceae bacterium]MCA6458733.1 DUF2892 domain-containing protein [Chitinophagaceae bacterium]